MLLLIRLTAHKFHYSFTINMYDTDILQKLKILSIIFLSVLLKTDEASSSQLYNLHMPIML